MPTIDDACRETLRLLACRAPGTTICPSEVACRLGTNWRGAMPVVHAAVDRLLEDGRVTLSWKGTPMPARTGPYRIAARPPRAPS